ncbi:hypothetical protein [Clostridium sp.]|uniref:hypothetical protein n=1 Tax=Clostridium sp. TaxID=1506 RepID=UPI00258F381E|nr:hypothetical protein [Clostridium sp.]MDF2504091.1 hypothetical protein [Clostridium sp.]
MEYIEIIPHEGIGPLKLGMSSEEILFTLEQLHTKWSNELNFDISKDSDIDCYRYQDGSSFFMVTYKNNKAVEIAVDYELREKMKIEVYGIDVFHTTAETLVSNLKNYSVCNYDMEDELLSTNYEFDDIGIRLWREEPFHPKLLSDESYINEMREVIDEMYQYLYFQIIAVKSL